MPETLRQATTTREDVGAPAALGRPLRRYCEVAEDGRTAASESAS